jgi:hypothetical protein
MIRTEAAMSGCGVRGWVPCLLIVSACGGKAVADEHEPREADVGPRRGVASECQEPPSEARAWSVEPCTLQSLEVESRLSRISDLAVDSDGLLVLVGDEPFDEGSAAATLQRYALGGAREASTSLEIRRGAALVELPEGVALVDRGEAGYFRLRRFSRDLLLVEEHELETPEPVHSSIVLFNAVADRDRLHVTYFEPNWDGGYTNSGYIHYARFDSHGASEFDVRITDPSGFVGPGDIQPFCGGAAVTSYRTRADGGSEVYLSYVDDGGGIVFEELLDRDVPQRMNSSRASFLDRPGDGTFLVTWLDTRLTRKEFSPPTAYSVAAIGYDGVLRWQKRLDLPEQVNGMPGAHWDGEVRVGIDGLGADIGGVLRLSGAGEPLETRELLEDRSALRALVPTPTGYASLSQLTGRGSAVLTIATCDPER